MQVGAGLGLGLGLGLSTDQIMRDEKKRRQIRRLVFPTAFEERPAN
jgi:hypothetical protein